MRRLEKAIGEALQKRGFSFVEIISPCPTLYGRMNKMREGLEQMKFYKEHARIVHGADPKDVDIDLGGDFIIGKFVDIEKPIWGDAQ